MVTCALPLRNLTAAAAAGCFIYIVTPPPAREAEYDAPAVLEEEALHPGSDKY